MHNNLVVVSENGLFYDHPFYLFYIAPLRP